MVHPSAVEGSVTLLGLILAAVLATGVLFVVSLVAYRRRQTVQYLLVSLAIAGDRKSVV